MPMSIGLGIGPTYSRSGGGVAAQPLRAVTNGNRIASGGFQTVAGTQLQVKSRISFTTGAGSLSQIVLSFYNWFSDPAGFTLNSNAYTIEAAALEIDGGISVPVNFSSVRTRVVAAGATDIQSDPILPSSFSLASFASGTKFWLRLHISLTTAGFGVPGGIPYENAGGQAFPSSVGFSYDPAVNTTTGAIDDTGDLSLGAGGFSQFNRPVFPVVLGRFVSGSPKVWLGIGDSIMQGTADTLEGVGLGFLGFFGRALVNATFNGAWGGGINMGSTGTTHAMWGGSNNAVAKAYWAYCDGAVENYGSNNFEGGAALATVQADSQALWTDLRAAGVTTILRMHIIPRTTSIDSWATALNQTAVSAAFGAGGLVEQYNTWLGAQISGSAITAQLALSSVRDSGTTWKWVNNLSANYATADGVHPDADGNALAANDLRTLLASYP